MFNKKNNYIWLFGENVGATSNNNSFYFWKYVVNKKKDGINKYIVLEKNETNKKKYKELSEMEKKSVVWRNSLKHFLLFFQADMYFVTLSYRDIRPEKFGRKKYDFKITKPLIYLQHGTLAIKKIGYKGITYNNNMLRFVYYNKNIKQDLIDQNDFRKYQLYYGKYLPRYQELARRNNLRLKENKESNHILWFLTWREYKPNSLDNKMFVKKINHILKNEQLHEYLKKNNLKIKFCIHHLYKTNAEKFMEDVDAEDIELVYASDIDLMDEIVESKYLITDYSSLGFDFTFLKKPVILYQPDRYEYIAKRATYCTIEELEQYSIDSNDEFIDTIVNEKYEINEFFSSRIEMDDIDYEEIEKGTHMEKMYNDFKKLQKNKITFLGYNFYGVGGTVNATRSLAEGLLEKGYMVELFSLKKTGRALKMPYALNLNCVYDSMHVENNFINRFRKNIWNFKKSNFKYLNYDVSKQYLKPYVAKGFEKYLSTMRSKTVISTRETLHLFLDDTKNEKIKNKIYFFHCQAEVIDELFPGIVNEISKRRLGKTVFVTEKNRDEYKDKQNYDNYDNSLILGNAIERKNVRNINKIEAVEEKEKYNVIYLLRISQEREADLNNLIGFAMYLKENKIRNIVIDVFGDGDYVEKFLDLLIENDLTNYIHYKGKTNDSTYHIRRHDALVDFSLNQSFGMTYIEGVLSGKMVYCMRNTGSLEVMKDIPEAFIDSYEDLANKINNLPNITVEELQENYRKIEDRYSRKVVTQKFIDYLKQGETHE